MNLLLLLSAFLTALTGAITGVRPVQAAAAQEQVLCAKQAKQVSAVVVAARPAQGWPVLRLSIAPAERPLALGLLIPAFGQRRRE